MTGRRFNYTGRRKITRDRVHVAVLPGDPSPELTAKVELDGMEFDPTDRVVVEVYLQSVIERVELGTVAAPRVVVAAPLSRFEDIEGLRCRIKVIADDGPEPGLIRGIADKLQPEGPDTPGNGRALLPFITDPGLGQRVWRLDTSEDTPVVHVNPMEGGWRSIVRSPTFSSLVLPEILEKVARWVAANRLGDEEEGPLADWASFFAGLGAEVDALVQTTPAEELDVIVEDVVRRFCAQHRFTEKLMDELAETDS